MSRRLLFLSFDFLRSKDPSPSLATSSIICHLQNHLSKSDYLISHEQINVRSSSPDLISSELTPKIQEFSPHSIASGIYIWNERFIAHLFKNGNFGGIFKIFGGPQITYNPKGSLEENYPWGDAFVRGYGEQSLLEFLKEFRDRDPSDVRIKGVHIKGAIDAGEKSDYNLSGLESPLLHEGLVKTRPEGFIRMETKRGCPFTCSFCQHKDSYEKRLKCDPERIRGEIEWISNNGIKDISIVDPIFNSGPDYTNILKEFLLVGYKGRLSLQSRFEMVSPEYLSLFSDLLNSGASIELEFGIQTINAAESKIIRRKNNLKKVLEIAAKLREFGIPFEVSLIYGLPLQTLDSFKGTINWVKEFLGPNALHAWALMLLKGTELYDLKSAYHMEEEDLGEELEYIDKRRQFAGIPHVVESSTFTRDEWEEMKGIANALLKDNKI